MPLVVAVKGTCRGAASLGTEFTISQTSDWSIDALSSASGGVVYGEVAGIVDVEVRSVEPEVRVSGSVEGAINANTQTIFKDDPNDEYPLVIADVEGRFGEALDGDGVQTVSEYAITTAEGAISFQ